jgi:molybdenum cofactor cytidylyltransferase
MTQSDTHHLDAIVLAAGRGVRFGGGKLVALLDDAPLVAGAILTASLASTRAIVVAVGPDPVVRNAVQATAARLPAPDRLSLAPVEDPAAGMGASLAAAARCLPDDSAGVFVFLGDMPRIDPATPNRLAARLRDGGEIIAPAHLGRRGHPVLFGGNWLTALRELSGDEGARAILDRATDRLILVPVDDPGVHLDVDHPSDLDRVRLGL